jgi:transcriptional regulator with XRE-family HTH domain
MYIHSFRLIAPRKLLDAQLFITQYHCYDEIKEVPDRLRWCRHHMGLMQEDVAAEIGVSRGYYGHLEAGDLEYVPKEIADKLAAFYRVPVDDLLDDYNRFLYYGQGRLIQKHRQRLELLKKPYAKLMKIGIRSLQEWESDSKQISKKSWEKYFKDVITV